jgi:hypothetical protein
MRKIILNLSGQKKIDRRALALRISLVLAASLACNGLSYRTLAHYLEKAENERAENRISRQKLVDLEWKTSGYQAFISAQKRVWSRKIDFANRLINQKTFSYSDRLGFLEKILPEGTQIQSLTITNNPADRIILSITAPSFARLMELYKKLSPFRLLILGESEKEGAFRANLQIVYSDDEK